MRHQAGMSLIEIIVVTALIGILASIAAFVFVPILSGSQYKEAARNIASALRDARSRAVSQNVSFSVEVDLDSRSLWLDDAGGAVVRQYDNFPAGVNMAIGADCTTVTAGDGDNAVGELLITFNPNGSSISATAAANLYVCVLDSTGIRKYRSGIESTVTSKAVINRRNPADTAWD